MDVPESAAVETAVVGTSCDDDDNDTAMILAIAFGSLFGLSLAFIGYYFMMVYPPQKVHGGENVKASKSLTATIGFSEAGNKA